MDKLDLNSLRNKILAETDETVRPQNYEIEQLEKQIQQMEQQLKEMVPQPKARTENPNIAELRLNEARRQLSALKSPPGSKLD